MHSRSIYSALWNGEQVTLFGARNEVINFMLTLESQFTASSDITVSLSQLVGPNGFTLQSQPAIGTGLFNWTKRQIELFYIRYLEIKGLSAFCCQKDDERQIPAKFRRPYDADGLGYGGWTDRPDHNTHYPDIAVPLELHTPFDIAANTSQSIWIDIFIPKTAPAGAYTGAVVLQEHGQTTLTIPVRLSVRNFALPDVPTTKTMLSLGYATVNERYLGIANPMPEYNATVTAIRNRHFQMAHRHKIALIDDDSSPNSWPNDSPRPEWIPRLNGSLFTSAQGYDGPGIGVGNGIFAIGTYGSWTWKNAGQAAMWEHTDHWVNWFTANAPTTEYFLFLIDESADYDQIETWSAMIDANPGPGHLMPSFATGHGPTLRANAPSLDIAASLLYVGYPPTWESTLGYYHNGPQRRFYLYNSGRPATGSFMIEDDGVALRELPWGQYKIGVDRWFYWESTYYHNYQNGAGQTNVFQQAQTFGLFMNMNPVLGESGFNYSNGDGVLFYPGIDTMFPEASYNVPGPFASLRLKYWRRGIQDTDYLALAKTKNSSCVTSLLQTMVPKVLWEYGVDDPADPTFVSGGVSWSSNPNMWERARAILAEIIETGTSSFCQGGQ